METNNKRAREVTAKDKVSVILTKEVLAQIQYTHHSCPKGDEWSALLVYQIIKGDINTPSSLVLKVAGLFPMDYGTSAFTSFEANEDWIKCFAAFPQVDPTKPEKGWYIGKIHSHNTMGVFHSATDKTDLHTSADSLPMFLSLIVNYACEVDCKLAIKIEVEETVITKQKYKFKGQDKYSNKTDTVTNKPDVLYILDCDVSYELDSWFLNQNRELKAKKYRAVTHYTPPANNWRGGTILEEKKEIRHPAVHSLVMRNLEDLLTLGYYDGNTGPYKVLLIIQEATAARDVEDFKKAFVMHFADSWFEQTFATRQNTLVSEAVESIEDFLKHHDTMWIAGVIKDALKLVREEYYELRSIQRGTMVSLNK